MLNEINSDKRLIDFWIDSEDRSRLTSPTDVSQSSGLASQKKLEPKPTPMFNLVWDSFFGWIWYVCMLLVFLGVPPLAFSQNIEMPDSWTAPRPTQVWSTGCCCETNTAVLNQIYQNQLFQEVQNRPSTIQEIHNTAFKSSSSLNNLLKGGNH